ncbi:MAG: hypothetical protein HXY50_04685 [Ignavibacteriaceae bacterium]|nr:hypothetical protein [Ignavibacteriaceae bacterium]
MKFVQRVFKDFWLLKSQKIYFSFFFIALSLILNSCERPTDTNQQNDGTPPAIPTGVSIVYSFDGEILIEWNQNSDLDLKGYNVYRKSSTTNFECLGFTSNNYYFDDSLSYDTTYHYKISAVDIWGEESEKSLEVSAAPINKYKPDRLRYININARNWVGVISIFLSWSPGYESDIAGYNIYRGLSSNFTADSTSFIGFTSDVNFSDTSDLVFYTEYFYKIRTVDKGGLISEESVTVSDEVYEIAELVFPPNNGFVNYFNYFKIKSLKTQARYQIVVQTNEYSGELWSYSFNAAAADSMIEIKFTPPYLYPYVYYYWRVFTFSGNNSEPNSISPFFRFRIKV